MSNEKENKKTKSAYVELEEKWRNQCQTISQQQDIINGLRKSGTEMGNEILHLKRVVAGQKGRLLQMAKELKFAKEDILAKEESIKGLYQTINDKNVTIVQHKVTIQELQDDVTVYKANYEYFVGLPWYKRIFFKG